MGPVLVVGKIFDSALTLLPEVRLGCLALFGIVVGIFTVLCCNDAV